ncbi:hypothetical protein GGR50DRAFT_689383 [Xylaria sp. CBS 124048]|nr:hypothetical protein GGR50DRAFT_689383 [Xylaria sp. CBS 124048]
MAADVPPKRRYWLLTSPRTASNLFIRILNLEEQGTRPATHGGYFFFPKVFSQVSVYSKPAEDWTPQDCLAVHTTAIKCFNTLQDHISESECAGQKVFIKEHVFFMNNVYAEHDHLIGTPNKIPHEPVQPMRGLTHATQSPRNLTCFPDEFLQTWYPTFLIRHPAMVLSSLYRTAQQTKLSHRRTEPFEIEVSLKFVRSLHDFYVDYYRDRDSQWPLVLDADDIMTSPDLVRKYASLVDLDASKLQFTWEKISEEAEGKLLPSQKVMLGTINASTGIDKGKLAGAIDIDAEALKWRDEFGDEGGRKLEQWVREAMPHYEYLYSRRLRL